MKHSKINERLKPLYDKGYTKENVLYNLLEEMPEKEFDKYFDKINIINNLSVGDTFLDTTKTKMKVLAVTFDDYYEELAYCVKVLNGGEKGTVLMRLAYNVDEIID